MKDKRQFRNKIAITSAALGLSSAAIFGLVAASVAARNANNYSANGTSRTNFLAARGGMFDVAQPFVPQPFVLPQPGVSPSILYHLPVIDESALSVEPGNPATVATREFVTRYYNNLVNYKLTTGQFGANFRQTVLPITTSFNDPILLDQARSALRTFSDVKTVGDNFDQLNGIGNALDTSRKLKIIQPEVRDVYSAQFNGEFVTRQGLLTNDEASYKVADINLKELANAKSLVFEYKDNADSTFASKHNFRIIISNENNDIRRFVDEVEAAPTNPNNPALKGSLISLINSRSLFVRDIERQNNEAQADAPTANTIARPQGFGQKVSFAYRYDETNQAPMLSILVQPSEANNSETNGIDFGVDLQLSDSAALTPQVLTYGLLDTSVSPRHTKALNSASVTSYTYLDQPTDLNRAIASFDPAYFYTNLPLFRSTSRWGVTNGLVSGQPLQEYNLLRLFVMQGAEFSQQLQFRGKTNVGADATGVFADLDSTFRITYNAESALVVTPREVGITRAALEAANQEQRENNLAPFDVNNPIKVYTQYHAPVNTAPTTQYAQVDVALAAGVLQFNYDNTVTSNNNYNREQPYSLNNDVVKKIFFEDPFSLGDPVFTNHDLQEIKTIVRPEVSNRDTQLISEIVSNWNGFQTDPLLESYIQPNSTYFNNNETGRFAATAGNFANFNSRNAQQFPGAGFAYTYRQYAQNSQNAITLLNTSINDSYVGRYDQDLTTMAMRRDSGGNLVAIEASAKNMYDHFVAYMNALVRWSIERFGVPATSLPNIDEYKLPDAGQAETFTRTRLLERGGDEAQELLRVARLLVRVWIGDLIPVAEQTDINNVFARFESAIPGARALIEGLNTGDNTTSDYKSSKQIIFYLLQPYLVRVINRILLNEITKFESNRLLTLGQYFNKFLNGTGNKTRLAAQLTGQVPITKELTNGMDMLAILRYGVEAAANGIESIRSLFTFIYNTKLQSRFLTPEEIVAFENFAARNFDLLEDPELFTDPNKRQSFTQLMSLTSSILANTFKENSNNLQLNDIVTKLQNGQYNLGANPDAPVVDIENTINSAINTIGSTNSFSTFEFYGSKFRMSFLETLVIGRNLGQIITQYLKLHDKDTGTLQPLLTEADQQTLQDFLAQGKQFNVASLFNFMVSRNITVPKFFANSLTDSSKVENTAVEYLNSDLAKSINLEVDSNIQELNTYGSIANLSQYFLIGIGAATVVSGFSAFGISFRRSARAGSKRSVVLERSFFVIVAAVGIALIIIGVVFPGIL